MRRKVLVNWDILAKKVMDFLSALPEKDMYISEQSRRYWLLKEHMEGMNSEIPKPPQEALED